MSKTSEVIKGGGGSVKVGSTGTISSLITRELQSVPQTPSSQTLPVSAHVSAANPKRQQPRKLSDEASSSFNHRNSETGPKTKGYARKTHKAPILGKKGSNMVEIVDIKCGNPDRAWASSMTTRLKKLGFSKLSESMI